MKTKQQISWTLISVALIALVAAIGCAKQPEVGSTTPGGPGVTSTAPGTGPAGRGAETPVTAPPAPREATLPPAPGGAAPGTGAASPLKDIFFDFDQAVLREDAKQALNDDIAWLKTNPGSQITLEGHCDERGTSEYNLGLGDRRAKAVREYLVAAGVDASRIRTISYGKERPFVLGHDEAAWRWNRRGHFVTISSR